MMKEIINKITKDDVDIIFTKDQVYKLILDKKVTQADLADISLLDSLANTKPVILSMQFSDDFEDFWPNIPKTPAMIMRNLNSKDCLNNTVNLEQMVKPLGKYLNDRHTTMKTNKLVVLKCLMLSSKNIIKKF